MDMKIHPPETALPVPADPAGGLARGLGRLHQLLVLAMAVLAACATLVAAAWAWQAWTQPDALMRLFAGFSLCG